LADSAPAYTAKTTQWLLAEFWFVADLPPYSPDLNQLDFATRRVLQAKVYGTPHSNLTTLRLSFAVEWDRLVAVYIRRRRRCHLAGVKKNEVKIE
jgi:hypothetical protein